MKISFHKKCQKDFLALETKGKTLLGPRDEKKLDHTAVNDVYVFPGNEFGAQTLMGYLLSSKPNMSRPHCIKLKFKC
jgi:hypothetical protein